jgi:predicted RNA-binding protein with PIN domain
VLEESAEAAEYLVRAEGMTLVVDGYNVSKSAWPSLSIQEQRRRLVDALAELEARAGVRIQVVFDGAEQAGPARGPRLHRTSVAVSFSPPDVEADDVIIARIADSPGDAPIVVASDDRRVRDEVRARGANVIGTRQLLDLLGRGTHGT